MYLPKRPRVTSGTFAAVSDEIRDHGKDPANSVQRKRDTIFEFGKEDVEGLKTISGT